MLFNVRVALVQALLTLALAAVLLDVPLRSDRGSRCSLAAIVVGTAGWFFFYAIFALRIRRNDAFNTVTSVFYFVFLFASSMFYPLDPLPRAFRGCRAGEPDHRGTSTCCATRRSASAIRGESRSKRQPSSSSRRSVFGAALQVLQREGD